ncbi:Anti-sigma-factor antagonist (fragment) [Candidatus Sulfopaludibacter sp. SbA3]
MSSSCRVECEVWVTISATPEAVEEFFAEFRRHTEARLASSHSFAAELLAREALNNAVVHGCGSDPSREVRCRLRLKGQRLTIVVADGGEGFDWRAAWGRRPGLSASSGRGMQILRWYATRVRYNERGNAVTIFKQCC